MKTPPEKSGTEAAINEKDYPVLARGVRVGRDPITREELLLFPEGFLPLESPTDDIVRLCDGSRTVRAIARSLAGEYDVEAETLRPDVLECISKLRESMLIVVSKTPSTGRTGILDGRDFPKMERAVDKAGGVAPQAADGLKSHFRPHLLLAELTYRCPLHCPYCSNPAAARGGDELSTEDWRRVLREAAGMGVLHVGFSGGEPLQRTDLPELVKAAREAGLYSNLITSAIGLNSQRAGELKQSGLDSVQISFQSDEEPLANRISGTASHAKKLEAARMVRDLGFPLTVNVVLHRGNIGRVGEIISLAESLGAERLELANVQYYGWAFRNRGALLPTRDQITRAMEMTTSARERLTGRMEILFVIPDYYSERPKPCMNGWGRRYLTVNPGGEVLPCPTAGEIKGLRFDNVRTRSLRWIWGQSEAFNRFRGTEWMPMPCRDCSFREIDFGGCRCQAALITGDANVTDPACSLSPHREQLTSFVESVQRDHAADSSFEGEAAGLVFRQNPGS
jgi:pyrroloquinoline quinone biosynthesis protein E